MFSALTFCFDFLSLFFVAIPRWIFAVYLKPRIFLLYRWLLLKLKNTYIFFIFKNIFNTVKYFFNRFFNYFYKIWLFINQNFSKYFYFYIYINIRNYSNLINTIIFIYLDFLIIKFFLNFLLNYNVIVLSYNFLIGNFLNLNDVMFVWTLNGVYGYIYLFLVLLNLDNIFLCLYILFYKIGIIDFYFNSFDLNFTILVFNWYYYYNEFKTVDFNFSFFNYFFLKFKNQIDILNIIELLNYFEHTPLFFYFGFLFFLTVIFSWFFFSYLGLYGLFKLNILSLFLFWISLLGYMNFIFVKQKIFIIKISNWFFLNFNVKLDCYFLIDSISFSFILLTTTIALFVFIYAFSYFRYEPLVDRFLLFILSFVISMIFLVSSGNIIMLFLGWELIGFTSFCLINFWTTKTATLKSAFKAFVYNKFSDFYLFMFLVISYNLYYTFDILSLNQQIYLNNNNFIFFFGYQINSSEILAIFLLLSAFVKSAQIGGHSWLPDSMEAPVPASSLIHSATLVSAGVYLILRFNFIFDSTEFTKLLIPLFGSLTAAYGGVCAIAQSDIKKTLAYSTISHCGFLMVLCSTEMNEFTILYLYVHGFFKAGVFMCVGNILRISRGYQDTRRMGGLIKYLPFEYFCASVGLLNLAGLPFTFGFFIKHLLLINLSEYMYIYYFILFNSSIGAFSGLFYSYKIIFYTFSDFKKGDKALYLNMCKIQYNSYFYTNTSKASTLSIFFLFLFSYIIVFFLFKFFLDGNFLFSDFFNNVFLVNYYYYYYFFSGFLLNFSYINITVLVMVLYIIFSKFKKTLRVYNNIKFLYFLILVFIFVFIFVFFL